MSQCTFWCSVLSDAASRLRRGRRFGSQCTFWCSVLSDPKARGWGPALSLSQCTFWCSVLSDLSGQFLGYLVLVSMHLLVLSAFRLRDTLSAQPPNQRLNAPFGAQCFPTLPEGRRTLDYYGSQCTFWCSVLSDSFGTARAGFGVVCLNAPFGAQCFPTVKKGLARGRIRVSMHLLVLSAFRLCTSGSLAGPS